MFNNNKFHFNNKSVFIFNKIKVMPEKQIMFYEHYYLKLLENRIKVNKIDETVCVGHEIPLNIPLYAVAGTERLILLVSTAPIIYYGLTTNAIESNKKGNYININIILLLIDRTLFTNMDEFYQTLSVDQELSQAQTAKIRKIFEDQEIGFKQLMNLTNDMLINIGLVQSGLRMAVLSVIQYNI